MWCVFPIQLICVQCKPIYVYLDGIGATLLLYCRKVFSGLVDIDAIALTAAFVLKDMFCNLQDMLVLISLSVLFPCSAICIEAYAKSMAAFFCRKSKNMLFLLPWQRFSAAAESLVFFFCKKLDVEW